MSIEDIMLINKLDIFPAGGGVQIMTILNMFIPKEIPVNSMVG